MQFRFKFRWAYIYNKVGKLELRTGKFIFPSLNKVMYIYMDECKLKPAAIFSLLIEMRL